MNSTNPGNNQSTNDSPLVPARHMPEVVEQALMHAFDGVAVLLDEKYIWLNDMHHSMYGYSLEESAGKTWRMLYDDAEVERIERDIFPIVGEKGKWQGICRGRRKNGAYFDVELSLAILPTGELVCCCRDVTQRIESERRQLKLTKFTTSLTQFLQAEIDAPNLSIFIFKLLSLLAEDLPRPCTVGIVPCSGSVDMHATWLRASIDTGPPELVESADSLARFKDGAANLELATTLLRGITGEQGAILGMDERPVIHREKQMATLLVATAAPLPADNALFMDAAASVLSTVLASNTLEREKLTLQRREQSTLDDLNLVAQTVGVVKWSVDLATGRFDSHDPLLLEEVAGHSTLTLQDLAAIIDPADFRQVYARFKSLLSKGDFFDMQFRIRTTHGEQRIVRTVALLNPPQTGKPAQLTGISYDVTERYMVGERLQRLEDYYVRLFELMRDGLAFCSWDTRDGCYRITRMNRALANMLGLEGETEFTDMPISGVFPANVVALFDSAALSTASVSRPYVTELTVTQQEKHLHYLRLEMGRFGGGQLSTVFLRGFNIDDEKRLLHEQERITELHETANEELRRASKLKDSFLANMSHELRTPLNGILGACDLLASGACGPLETRQSDILSMAETAGRHLLSIISDILDLSKINSGKMHLSISSFSVKEILDNVAHFLGALASGKNIALRTDIEDSASLILHSDRVRLTQVLTNLVSNAVKFSPEGAEVQVVARRDPRTGNVCLRVSDKGPGIAQSQQTLIFCQFEQVDIGLARPHEGTGLGLALVRSLVQMLGGHILVASEPGQGSHFDVVLPPSSRKTIAGQGQLLPAHGQPQLFSRQTGPNVFVIDPLRTRAHALEQNLLDAGCQCTCFEDVAAAMLAVRSLHPVLILIELGEPGFSTASVENVEMLVELSRGSVHVIGISPVLIDSPRGPLSQIYGCSPLIKTVIAPPWGEETRSLLLATVAQVERERLGAA